MRRGLDILMGSDIVLVMWTKRFSYLVLISLLFVSSAACGTDAPYESPVTPPSDIGGLAERVHPTLVLVSPTPGTFVTGNEVLFRGVVSAGSAPLTQLTINGQEIPIESGGFEYMAPVSAGPNIFSVRVQAEDMGRAVDAVTVYGSSTHPSGVVLSEGMQVQLRQEFLDNNTPELDDLAGILEALLKNQAFLEAFVAEPFEFGEDSTIEVTRIIISDAQIDLVAQTGCIDAAIVLGETKGGGGSVEIDLFATGLASILGDEVMLFARSIRVKSLICPVGRGEALRFEVREPEVDFVEFRLATDQYPNLMESFPTASATLIEYAEDAIAEWMGNSLADLVMEMLDGIASGYTFGTAPVVTANFGLEAVDIGTYGMLITFSANFVSEVGLPNLSEAVGFLRTDDPPLAGGFSNAPVAVALSDDAMNQLMFAVWYGGGVANYEIATEELDALPQVFQPLSAIDVSLSLPPTFVAPTQEEYAFDIAVGGIGLDIVSGADRRFNMGLHMQAGVNIVIDDEGLISLKLDNRAQRINVQANVRETPPEHDGGDIAALLRMMVPPVLGSLNVGYGGFPIPSFDLATFSEDFANVDSRAVTFMPSSFGRQGQGGGYFVVEGALREER